MSVYVLICDIDNCFTDSRDWFAYVPEANSREGWDEYLKHDDLCKPNKPVIDLVCSTAEILPVFFVTSREDRFDNRKNTIQQIKDFSNNKIDMFDESSSHKLFMRHEFDYRPSKEVKEEVLNDIVSKGYIPIVAIDDDEENCKMFSKYNIPTVLYNIDNNEFTKYSVIPLVDLESVS